MSGWIMERKRSGFLVFHPVVSRSTISWICLTTAVLITRFLFLHLRQPCVEKESASARSDARHDDAGDIARQRETRADERTAEPVHLAECRKATDHRKADDEQERRVEEELALRDRQIAVDQTEEHRPHAVARVETNPASPDGRLPGYDQGDLVHSGSHGGITRCE